MERSIQIMNLKFAEKFISVFLDSCLVASYEKQSRIFLCFFKLEITKNHLKYNLYNYKKDFKIVDSINFLYNF